MDRVDYESVTIQDLLSAHARGELNIEPWYQRRSVWKRPQKAYLINTIFEKKPVPSIYIRHVLDLDSEKSIKEVVDGQQRMRCVIDYCADEFPASHPEHEARVKFSELTKSQRQKFRLTAMSVGYLIAATDQDVIQIFARINSVAKTLNPQEKRNAIYSGAFKQFSTNESSRRLQFWRDYQVFTDNDISRMAEVQFVSDLAMNLSLGLQDFSAKQLDNFYKDNDEAFVGEKKMLRRIESAFSRIVDLSPEKFRGSIFCRPQVLFSLIVVLDSMPAVSLQKIERCVSYLDAAIEAVRSGDNISALSTDVYEAFTTGNMHRIRFRRMRDKVIRARLR